MILPRGRRCERAGMKFILASIATVFALLLCAAQTQKAPAPSVEQFLNGLSSNSKGTNAEVEEGGQVADAIATAHSGEVSQEIPEIFDKLRQSPDRRVRAYAVAFLVTIAQRPDGKDLLGSRSHEIADLLQDPDEGIQKGVIALIDWVAASHPQVYLPALRAAIAKPNLSQDLGFQLASALLAIGSLAGDAASIHAALGFIERKDLTWQTRMQIAESMGTNPGVPDEVCRELVKALDDPDPRVRAAAIVAFAGPTSSVHSLAQGRIERMSRDPQENRQVRHLAAEALAGHAPLNPNIEPDAPQ